MPEKQIEKSIARIISDLVLRDDDFRHLSERQDVYCPFEAIGAARMEVKHSNFLANLLSPNGTHGFGETMLRCFLDGLMSETNLDEISLDLHLTDLSNAIVLREWQHIDLFIRFPNFRQSEKNLIFVVELKVEAAEHGNQLEEYEKVAEEKWPNENIHYFFLTPNQTQSSRDNWVDVSFSSVLDEMERGLKFSEGHPDARRMVNAYISMMRRRYVTDEQMDALANQIWSKHKAALEFLIARQPNAASDLLQEVQSSDITTKVNLKLAELGIKLSLTRDSASSRYIRFAVKEWDAINWMHSSENWVQSKRILLLEIEFHSGGVHARWVVGRGPREARLKIISAIDPDRTKKVTNDFTRIATRAVLDKRGMDKISESGVDQKSIDKVIAGITILASQTIPQYDASLRKIKSEDIV